VSVFADKHSDSVRQLQFSELNPNLLASASDDSTAVVFDVSTSETKWRYDGHTDYVRGISWSLETEGLLATASWDKTFVCHQIK